MARGKEIALPYTYDHVKDQGLALSLSQFQSLLTYTTSAGTILLYVPGELQETISSAQQLVRGWASSPSNFSL